MIEVPYMKSLLPDNSYSSDVGMLSNQSSRNKVILAIAAIAASNHSQRHY